MADAGYLVTIGLVAILIGAASLYLFRPTPAMAAMNALGASASVAAGQPAGSRANSASAMTGSAQSDSMGNKGDSSPAGARPQTSTAEKQADISGSAAQNAPGQNMDAMQAGDLKISLASSGQVWAGAPSVLTFRVTDPQSGKAIHPLGEPGAGGKATSAPMHVFITDRELSYFTEIHPQPASKAGEYTVEHRFPASGDYVLYSELAVAGSSHSIAQFDLKVSGAAAAQLTPNMLPKRSEGYSIDLQPVGTRGTVTAGQPARFIAVIGSDGKAKSDRELQALVGKMAHLIVLDESAGSLGHVGATVQDIGFGPSTGFEHTFVKPGLYKLWLRFIADQIVQVEWVVEVK